MSDRWVFLIAFLTVIVIVAGAFAMPHYFAFEILKSSLRTREYLEKGEGEGKTLVDAMRDGEMEGMQHFDGEIEKLIRNRVIDMETGCAYATNSGNLRLQLADFADGLPEATIPG